MHDWRLQGQERYLANQKLTKKQYDPPSADWDHDHCEFCGEKFSLEEGDLKEGYVTEDKKHWICSDCQKDFRELFKWIINNDSE